MRTTKKLMKFRLISSCLIASIIIPVIQMTPAYAASSTASNQATATVSAVCTIVAQNLNFGNLVLPLSAQSASTSMSVLCSKNHAYTVGLAYGGVYGVGSGYQTQTLYLSNYNATAYVSGTQTALSYYGGYNSGVSWSAACQRNGSGCIPQNAGYTTAGSVASGAKGCPNTGFACTVYTTTQSQIVTGTYSYGEMTGVASGDKVAYSIQVPGNPGQVWNTGNSSYSSTGTGADQSIPVVGTLVPAQSSGNYPTPDYYLDTVTATVSF
jgi:spore coat protein U-like protein